MKPDTIPPSNYDGSTQQAQDLAVLERCEWAKE